LASLGITLLGSTSSCRDGILQFAPDLAKNIARGDRDYLSVLDRADAYVSEQGLVT
jgi:putative flavoprotein involved in K+ transport